MYTRREENESGFLAFLLLLLIIMLLVLLLAAMSRTTDQERQILFLQATDEQVIVLRDYHFAAVAWDGEDPIFLCQNETGDVNLLVECGPGESVGNIYYLPEGFTVVGGNIDTSHIEKSRLYCKNIRTEQVRICVPHLKTEQ